MLLGQGFVQVGLKQKGIKSGLANLKQMFGGFFAAVGAGALFRSAFQLAQEQEMALARLSGVLNATGHVAGFTRDSLERMATGLASVTRHADEAIHAGQGILLTFKNIRGSAFEKTIELGLDLAEVLGQDLRQSMVQLGKAMEDPMQGMTALRRVGISFTEAEKEKIKVLQESGRLLEAQAVLLKLLKDQVGGTAREVGDTWVGEYERIVNRGKDALEDVGSAAGGFVVNRAAEAIQILDFMAEKAAEVYTGISVRDSQRMRDVIKGRDLARQRLAEWAMMDEQAERARWNAEGKRDDERQKALDKATDAAVKEKAAIDQRIESLKEELAVRKLLWKGEEAEMQGKGKSFAAERYRVEAEWVQRTQAMIKRSMGARSEDTKATELQNLKERSAKLADIDRREKQDRRDRFKGIADEVMQAERSGKIDYLRAMGLDEEAAKAQVDAVLAQTLAGFKDLKQRIRAQFPMRGASLEAAIQDQMDEAREIAALEKARIGKGDDDVRHRTASLREIGLAAQGKLPGQQAKGQVRENAAKETAKNTARAVTVLERIERKSGAKYQ
jgi:hypothetical protein